MHEIYNEMYEKMDRHRRSLILERVRTAEKASKADVDWLFQM